MQELASLYDVLCCRCKIGVLKEAELYPAATEKRKSGFKHKASGHAAAPVAAPTALRLVWWTAGALGHLGGPLSLGSAEWAFKENGSRLQFPQAAGMGALPPTS
jgi:hypothetical protein